MTGKYREAAHNECNCKLKLNPKRMPIPVIFHNLKGYDGHLLMQAMARVRGEIKCIPTNTEKYISFSLGNLRLIHSVNFLLSSLEKLVEGSDEFLIMEKMMPEENKRQLLLKWNSKKGRILEVDLEYPAHLHDAHNDYPLAPEKKAINPAQTSEYQRRLMVGLNLDMPNTEKLVLTLEDKEKYVTHYSNLQFYLRQGMRLKKVHRVIEFDQEPWMEPYIRMNTEFRKQAKSDFETDFYKLMNNSVFGKTMENLRNRVDVKIVRDWETDKICKLLSSPSFDRHTFFGNDMAGIHMHKPKLVLNKPVYTGMTILENSKILMYDFFHNHLKARYGHKCELVYTDTDSLILDIKTEDVYKDMQALMVVRHKKLPQRPSAVERCE